MKKSSFEKQDQTLLPQVKQLKQRKIPHPTVELQFNNEKHPRNSLNFKINTPLLVKIY